MKRITVAAFFALAGILGAGNAFAQSHEVRATVPFNFTVGSKALPAGNYSITPVSDSVIEIQNSKTHAAILTQTAEDSNQSQNGGELVFNRHAGQYSLSEVLCPSAAMNVSLPSSKMKKRTEWEDAKLHKADGLVLIPAGN